MAKKLNLSQSDRSIIKEEYPSGGIKACKEKLSRDLLNHQIVSAAQRMGVKRIKDFDGPTCNINDFKNPTDPRLVYYLGLAWADGHLSFQNLEIVVIEEDGREFYEMFRDVAHFRVRIKKSKRYKNCLRITLSNRELVRYLKTIDFDKKSLVSPTKLLSTIPKNLHRFFWLGFFDGDGSLSRKKGRKTFGLCFGGTYQQNWEELINFLIPLGANPKVTRRVSKNGSRSSRLDVLCLYDVLNICECFYKDFHKTHLGLLRKRERFLTMKKHFGPRENSKFKGIQSRGGSRKNYYNALVNCSKGRASANFQKEIDAVVFWDKMMVFFFGHRCSTNFPLENYIEVGVQNYKPIDDPRLELSPENIVGNKISKTFY